MSLDLPGGRELDLKTRAMDQAPVGITISDATREDNPIIYANDGFEEMTGYPSDEVIGRNCRFLQGEKTDPEPVGRMREAIDAGEPVTVELRNYRKDGTEFWNRVSISPLYDDDGRVRNFVGFQEDVTDRVEYRQRLQGQNERLETFASMVSHDLRNPLNVAEGRLELAREELADGDVDGGHLDAVADAHERMATLVEDILTLAREGDIAIETRTVSLADVVAACRETVARDAATVAVEAGADAAIRADERRLRQLVENLVRNAVEHGRTDVHVEVGAITDGGGFYVADDGPGIPENEREKVFDEGYTTDDEGIGMGLSIVRQVAAAHGWDVSVTESAAGGARFEITGVEML